MGKDYIIVYGPQGCGKTNNKDALLKWSGCSKVIDGWWPGMQLSNDTLYLTCADVGHMWQAISFEDAMESIKAGKTALDLVVK